jgi:hypothetical protein
MKSYDNCIINAIKRNIITNNKILKYFNFTYTTQKHKIEDILREILKVIKYGIPWRLIENIPYSTVYSSYKRLLYFNILRNTYIDLLHLYFKKQPNQKLKYQYTDTTCVSNKYGSEFVEYNGYKKKKCTKLSFITDSKGIPINVSIHNGKQNDGKILVSHFNNMLITNDLNNKNKKYMLADSIYYVKEVKDLLTNEGYVYIIPPNIKNTKYKKIEKLTSNQMKIYSKRIKIEHTNSILKNYRRLNCRYDRDLNTFYG